MFKSHKHAVVVGTLIERVYEEKQEIKIWCSRRSWTSREHQITMYTVLAVRILSRYAFLKRGNADLPA